jgi:hypothetical protein
MVATRLDQAAVQHLQAGHRVVLSAEPRSLAGKTTGRFDPIFWNRLWFPSQPQHTLGLLLDPRHPALAQFPTSFHADWQWQDLQNHSRPVVLDNFPRDFHPIVQVIDDWNSCRKLGLIFEAKVGAGRLLFCAIDLNKDLAHRPTARQLRASLLDYAVSDRFQPKARLELAEIQTLFRDTSVTKQIEAKVISCDSAEPGHEASLLLDGDPDTMWHTPWGDKAPGFPHEVILGFDQTSTVQGLLVLPRQDGNHNGWIKEYAIYVNGDMDNWGEPVARGHFAEDSLEKRIQLDRPVQGKFLKFVALSSFDAQPFASLAELNVLSASPEK